jgi:N-acetylglucosamine kinase-like BadF-type ATPase
MPIFLALDAGGTSTRAVLIDAYGRCLGYGRASSGNPTSAGIPHAVAAVGAATDQALAGIAVAVGEPSLAVLALAGQKSAAFEEQVSARLAPLGFGPVILEPDLIGIFGSGTHLRDGYAMVAGTGTAAVRVVGGQLDRVVGGRGWLLGDAGGGYWIGHQVARAVVSALDGQGAPTALTERLLATVAIPAPADSADDGVRALKELVSVLYSWRPVQLSRFAPLAFQVPDDPVAGDILVAASSALTELLAAVRVPGLAGPVIVGGSVLIHGLLAAAPGVRERLVLPAETHAFIPVVDGVVGAAVLALRRAGVEVDAALFATIQVEVAQMAHRRSDNPAV